MRGLTPPVEISQTIFWQTVRGDPANPSVQPLLISGRVLLPLRFVSENLDTWVDWDPSTRTVTVTQN
ncbi:MAG: stalk domain-containing protein [Clostridia bacterium]|nr:stalk domain-containing protein [Clostridia bacterium]